MRFAEEELVKFSEEELEVIRAMLAEDANEQFMELMDEFEWTPDQQQRFIDRLGTEWMVRAGYEPSDD